MGKSIPMGKRRPVDQPYLTVDDNGWVIRVLKAYSTNPDAPYARVYAYVNGDLGDTYWADVRGRVVQIDDEVPLEALPRFLRVPLQLRRGA